MKEAFCTVIGMFGSLLAYLLGGWNAPMKALVVLMIIDYISGLMVAGIFHKSKKSENGALNSNSGMKGLCKKCMIILMVIAIAQVSMAADIKYLRNTVVIGFATNEFISIIENGTLMGIPILKPIRGAIDVLNERSNSNEDKWK